MRSNRSRSYLAYANSPTMAVKLNVCLVKYQYDAKMKLNLRTIINFGLESLWSLDHKLF